MDTLGADLSPCVLVQPDGWARGEREGYGEPCDVTSISLKVKLITNRGQTRRGGGEEDAEVDESLYADYYDEYESSRR